MLYPMNEQQMQRFTDWMRKKGYTMHKNPATLHNYHFKKRYTQSGDRFTGGTMQFDAGEFTNDAYIQDHSFQKYIVGDLAVWDTAGSGLNSVKKTDEYYNAKIKIEPIRGLNIHDVYRKEYHVRDTNGFETPLDYHKFNIEYLEDVAVKYMKRQRIKKRTRSVDI